MIPGAATISFGGCERRIVGQPLAGCRANVAGVEVLAPVTPGCGDPAAARKGRPYDTVNAIGEGGLWRSARASPLIAWIASCMIALVVNRRTSHRAQGPVLRWDRPLWLELWMLGEEL